MNEHDTNGTTITVSNGGTVPAYPYPTGGVPVHPNTWADKIVYPEKNTSTKKHNHYFKDVTKLDFIDVYRVLSLFNVTDPCIQHAIKKLLVAGGRGAGKDINKDIQESIDSLIRWQDMQKENV
jgi:hypothetical protein